MNIINVVCGYAGSVELTYNSTFLLNLKKKIFFFILENFDPKIRETYYNQIGMA